MELKKGVETMKGTVKTKTDRGFGFISRDGEQKDLFFHSKDLVGMTFDEVQVGDVVMFEIVDGPKGPSAKSVRRVDADAAPAMETEEVEVAAEAPTMASDNGADAPEVEVVEEEKVAA
jgi:cold shock protein